MTAKQYRTWFHNVLKRNKAYLWGYYRACFEEILYLLLDFCISGMLTYKYLTLKCEPINLAELPNRVLLTYMLNLRLNLCFIFTLHFLNYIKICVVSFIRHSSVSYISDIHYFHFKDCLHAYYTNLQVCLTTKINIFECRLQKTFDRHQDSLIRPHKRLIHFTAKQTYW